MHSYFDSILWTHFHQPPRLVIPNAEEIPLKNEHDFFVHGMNCILYTWRESSSYTGYRIMPSKKMGITGMEKVSPQQLLLYSLMLTFKWIM